MRLLNYLNKSEVSIAILLATAILSMSFPYGFPLYTLLSVFFIVLKVISGKFKIRINIGFVLFILCILIYLSGVVISGKIYSLNITDIINMATYILFWVLLSDLKREDYPKFIHNFAKFVIGVTSFVSVVALYKFYKLLGGEYIDFFYTEHGYRTGTALVADYNMFCFALSSGLIMTLYMVKRTIKMKHIFFHLFSGSMMFTSILFAGSRRGWIVAVIILLLIILMVAKFFIRYRFEIVTSRLLKFGFIFSFIAFFVFLILKLIDIDLNFTHTAQLTQLQYRFSTLNDIGSSFSTRTIRWDYALQMFNQYNFLQILFGSGFEYMPIFGQAFTLNSPVSYPHNPFLSILLYSGLIGLFTSLVFLILSVFKAIANRKLLTGNFIFFYFIAWVFMIISGNSLFSIKTLMLLILIILAIPSYNSNELKIKEATS